MYPPTRHPDLLPLARDLGYSRHVRIGSCRLDEAHVQIRGELVDDRADFQVPQRTVSVHALVVRITVRLADRVITEAEAAYPKLAFAGVCDQPPTGPEALLGLVVDQGLTRAIKERFSGVCSCYHLSSLLQAMVPALTQCFVWNDTFPKLDAEGTRESVPNAMADMARSIRNTCHAWKDGGFIQTEIAEGRPEPVLQRVAPGLLRRLQQEESPEEGT